MLNRQAVPSMAQGTSNMETPGVDRDVGDAATDALLSALERLKT